MTAAASTRTVADPLTIVRTHAQITTANSFPGRAPQGTTPFFVNVAPIEPWRIGQSLAAEAWGKILARYQITAFGDTVDQAEQLCRQLLELDWTRQWELQELVPVFEDLTMQPPGWGCGFVIREAST